MRISRRSALASAWAGALMIALTGLPAMASDNYPAKPVRVVVPYAPGGTGDLVFRLITDPLGARLGQPFVMDYHAGAGGTMGVNAVAQATPDGYSIGVGSSDAVALAPHFYQKLGYSPLTDLAPIAIVAEMPLVLVVRSDSPFRTLAEFLQAAGAKPGTISYGTPGHGSSPHIMGELLSRNAGVELTHVPYKGTGPAIQDLLGGHIDAIVVSGFDSVPMEKAGRIHPLAVTGGQRYPLLAQTPTFQESGVDGLNDLRVWFGLFAPSATPDAIIGRLSAEIDSIISTPEFIDRAAELGFVPVRATPGEVRQRVQDDVRHFADMIRTTGVRPD